MSTLSDEDLDRLGDRLRDCFATVIPTLDTPGVGRVSADDGQPGPRWRWLAVAAGVAVLAGGVLVMSTPTHHSSMTSGSVDTTDAPVESDVPPSSHPGRPSANAAWAAIVRPLLPPGYRVLFQGRTVVTAVNTDGVRLDVRLGLGVAEQARKESDGMGGNFPEPGVVVTPAGDLVSAVARFTESPPADVGLDGPDVATLAASVVAHFGEAERRAVEAEAEPTLGSTALSDELQAQVRAFLGELGAAGSLGWGSAAVGNFESWYQAEETSLAVAALWMPDAAVSADVARPSPRLTVAFWRVGEWTLVLTERADEGAALSEDELAALRTAASEPFQHWTPPTPEPGCSVYALRSGDSLQSIAASFGLTAEALSAANPDFEQGAALGSVIVIPCGGRAEAVSADQSDLDRFAAAVDSGFIASAERRVASDRRAWVISTGRTAAGHSAFSVAVYERGTGQRTGNAEITVEQCGAAISLDPEPIEALGGVRFTCGTFHGRLDLLRLNLTEFAPPGS